MRLRDRVRIVTGDDQTARAGAGYNPALAAFLRECARTGLLLDFTNNRYFLRRRFYSDASRIPGWSYTRTNPRYAGDTTPILFSANTPRIVPGSGIRVTAGATNLLLESQSFNSPWSAWNNRISTTEIAPDGTATASRVSSQVGSTASSSQGVGTFTGSPETLSIFIKQGTSPQFEFGLYNSTSLAFAGAVRATWSGGVPSLAAIGGTPTLQPVANCGNGWWRIAFSASSTAGNSRAVFIYPETASGGAATGVNTLIWGAQLEAGSVATDYIPTTSSAVTAGADAASVTGLSFSGAHSVIALTGTKGANGNELVFQLDDGSNANRTAMYRSAGTVTLFSDSGGVNQAVQFTLPWTTSAQRFAMRNQTNDIRGGVDGSLTSADTACILPAGTLSRLQIGNNGSLIFDGWIRALAVLPRALTDTELQLYTDPDPVNLSGSF